MLHTPAPLTRAQRIQAPRTQAPRTLAQLIPAPHMFSLRWPLLHICTRRLPVCKTHVLKAANFWPFLQMGKSPCNKKSDTTSPS